MESVTFECEVITPMFLADADGKTPELRPPSIKGAMRFWWRAMNGHLSIKELRERETEIFGGSEGDGKRSIISIKVDNPKFQENEISKSLWNEIPHQNKVSTNNKPYNIPNHYKGLAYLFYSMIIPVGSEREYIINPLVKRKLIVSGKNQESLDKAINTLWCLSFLGALGSRSRRGGGTIKLKPDTKEYLNFFDTTNIENKTQLKQFIQDKCNALNLKKIVSNNYSILKNSRIYIFEPKEDWKEALEFIGKPFADFRNNNKSQITKTPNFGFPVMHKNKTIMGAGVVKNNKVEDFLERNASPLIFKVIKTKEKKFFPLIIWLNNKLIPDDYQIMDKFGGNTAAPNDDIIQEFIDTLKFEEIKL